MNQDYPNYTPPDEVKAESPEVEVKPDIETFNRLVEMLRTNPNINFTVAARGNVTAEPNMDDKGARRFQYSKASKKMIVLEHRLSGLDDTTWWMDATKDCPGVFEKIPYYVEYPDTFLMGFRQFQVGKTTGKYNTDSRQGPFFAGFEASRTIDRYTEQERETIIKLGKLVNSDPQQFIQMMEALCRGYIPEYYREQQEIEQTIRDNLKNRSD